MSQYGYCIKWRVLWRWLKFKHVRINTHFLINKLCFVGGHPLCTCRGWHQKKLCKSSPCPKWHKSNRNSTDPKRPSGHKRASLPTIQSLELVKIGNGRNPKMCSTCLIGWVLRVINCMIESILAGKLLSLKLSLSFQKEIHLKNNKFGKRGAFKNSLSFRFIRAFAF